MHPLSQAQANFSCHCSDTCIRFTNAKTWYKSVYVYHHQSCHDLWLQSSWIWIEIQPWLQSLVFKRSSPVQANHKLNVNNEWSGHWGIFNFDLCWWLPFRLSWMHSMVTTTALNAKSEDMILSNKNCPNTVYIRRCNTLFTTVNSRDSK